MTSDGLAQAQREIAVMRRLHHPCLLPLLGASVTPQADEEHGSKYVVHMLFPLYSVRGQPASVLLWACCSVPTLAPEHVLLLHHKVIALTPPLAHGGVSVDSCSSCLHLCLRAIHKGLSTTGTACPRLAVLCCELSACLMQAGSLYDELSRQAAAGTRLLLRDVLSIFLQVRLKAWFLRHTHHPLG